MLVLEKGTIDDNNKGQSNIVSDTSTPTKKQRLVCFKSLPRDNGQRKIRSLDRMWQKQHHYQDSADNKNSKIQLNSVIK
jgi:hypothetical protein